MNLKFFRIILLELLTAIVFVRCQLETCPDCIAYSLNTQSVCMESAEIQPEGNTPGWSTGFDLTKDYHIIKANIVAYKIKWFNGEWSDWYVKGFNDVDKKFNTNNKSLRRMWSYFADHTHKYIYCRSVL